MIAIYNIWDAEEHLEESVRSIRNTVDEILCVCQITSNLGENYDGGCKEALRLKYLGLVDTVLLHEPKGFPQAREISKRQFGIDYAKGKHDNFIVLDCDEVYQPEEFKQAYQIFKDSCKCGSVAQIVTHIKEKGLGYYDNYHVPTFHKLNKSTLTGVKAYPYYVDPTRRINCSDVIQLPLTMHHYSYIRNDIDRKLRNSTAYVNLLRKREMIHSYLNDAAPGKMFFGHTLEKINLK